MVPDLLIAKIDLDKIWSFILSSEITSTFLISYFEIKSLIKFFFSKVEWNINCKFLNLFDNNFIDLINIGNNNFNSDNLLPGKTEIIFLLVSIKFEISVFWKFYFSTNGWPTKVLLIFSLSKYFFSKLNNNNMWSTKFLNFFTLPSLHTQTCGAT